MSGNSSIPAADIKVALSKYASLTMIKVCDLMDIFHCSRATAQKLKHLVPATSIHGAYMETVAAFHALQLDVDMMMRQAKYLDK